MFFVRRSASARWRSRDWAYHLGGVGAERVGLRDRAGDRLRDRHSAGTMGRGRACSTTEAHGLSWRFRWGLNLTYAAIPAGERQSWTRLKRYWPQAPSLPQQQRGTFTGIERPQDLLAASMAKAFRPRHRPGLYVDPLACIPPCRQIQRHFAGTAAIEVHSIHLPRTRKNASINPRSMFHGVHVGRHILNR